MKKKTQSIRELMHKALELPPELSGLSRMVLYGNRELSIQNYKGIISYENTSIRLNTEAFILHIRGENLEIRHINDEDVVVSGRICGIDME